MKETLSNFFNFKNKKFLDGILTGAITTLLVSLLAGFLLCQSVPEPPPPPKPLVTAEQVVEAGYGVILVNEETQEEEFYFYSQKKVFENYKEMKREKRKQKVKDFFGGIWDFFSKPFRKK